MCMFRWWRRGNWYFYCLIWEEFVFGWEIGRVGFRKEDFFVWGLEMFEFGL